MMSTTVFWGFKEEETGKEERRQMLNSEDILNTLKEGQE